MKTKAPTCALAALLLLMFVCARIASSQAAGVVDGGARSCASEMHPLAVTHRAGLVVTFGDRHTKTFCVDFAEETITGLQLLQRAGLALVTSGSGGLGSAVCSIDGTGSADPTNCFASCTGGSCTYWAYYRFANGAWQFSQAGASQTAVHDGDVQGWAWGPGGTSAGAAPVTPGEICPHPTSTPATIPISTPPPAVPSATATTALPQPTPRASTAAGGAPTAIANMPSIPGAPAQRAPTAALAQPVGPPTPAVSPVGAVQGAARAPADETPAPDSATARPGSTTTPKSGAILIGNDQGDQNEARSESAPSDGGGRVGLILFGVVAIGLVAAGAGVLYRRRRAV